MIFYFSGTGNSAWVAQQMAHLIDDQAYDIISLSELPDIQKAERIGFIFPIYAWGVPEVMAAFAKKLVKTRAFAFGICTCGGNAGLAMKRFSKYYTLDSSYSLVMPSNYIVGMDAESEDAIQRKISHAREEMQRMSQEILRQEPTYRVHEGKLAGIKSYLANFGFNKFARNTKPFTATDRCNGCGLCAQHCPASAISLQDGKPIWTAQCYQCMRCINECPQQAIEYGKATIDRHRYTIQNYLPQNERF